MLEYLAHHSDSLCTAMSEGGYSGATPGATVIQTYLLYLSYILILYRTLVHLYCNTLEKEPQIMYNDFKW